jgi:hypothetical protein
MIVAEDTNTLLGPRVALGRAYTKSIENGCDAPVPAAVGQQGPPVDYGDRLNRA